MIGSAIGGAALGFLEKTFPNIPTVPLIGKKGTVAIVAYFLHKRGGFGGHLVRDIGLAAAVLAGYQLGKEGRVDGDVMGDLAPQVSGIASQI
jgi:hypothetical protein